MTPLIAAPLGTHLLVESKASIADSFSPKAGGSGYDSSWFLGLTYLQLDYLATSHVTVVGGEFLTPFGTYNERLSPIWIGNFTDAPLIFPWEQWAQDRRWAACSAALPFPTSKFSVDYAAYFSAASTNYSSMPNDRPAAGQEFTFLRNALSWECPTAACFKVRTATFSALTFGGNRRTRDSSFALSMRMAPIPRAIGWKRIIVSRGLGAPILRSEGWSRFSAGNRHFATAPTPPTAFPLRTRTA